MATKYCSGCGNPNKYETNPPQKCSKCNKEFFSAAAFNEYRPTSISNNFRATYDERRENIVPEIDSLSISVDNEPRRGIKGKDLVGQGSSGAARPNRGKPLSKKQYAEKLKQFEQSFISKIGTKTNIDDRTID